MDAAASATGSGRGRIAGARRVGELPEPGPNRRERPHEAARLQQLTPRPPAGAQKTVQPLLLHFVHVQEPIRRPLVERAVLDVLAKDPGALFVATTEQSAAIVIMRRPLALALIIMLVRHAGPMVVSAIPS